MNKEQHVKEQTKKLLDKLKWYSDCIENIKKNCKDLGKEETDNKICSLECLLDLEIKITKLQMKLNGCCDSSDDCCSTKNNCCSSDDCCSTKNNCCSTKDSCSCC